MSRDFGTGTYAVRAESLPTAIRWTLLTALVILLLELLRIPLDARDPIVVALAVLVFVLALYDFTGAWLILILALPFASLIAGMFDQPKITGLRIFLIAFGAAFFFGRKPADFWRALLQHLVFKGLVFFILANLLSALFSGQIAAVFHAVVYIEPLLYFVFSYYAIRQSPARISHLVWAIAAGALVVALLGLVEFAAQRPLVEVLGLQYTTYKLSTLRYYLAENRLGVGGRISSVLIQPVYAGLYFAACLIAQVFYVWVYTPDPRKWLVWLVPFGLVMVLVTGSARPYC